MIRRLIETAKALRWGGLLAALTLSVAPAGCSPEGTGTVKIENPQETRSKFEGAPAAGKTPASGKQANALKIEEEAAKKNPKLR